MNCISHSLVVEMDVEGLPSKQCDVGYCLGFLSGRKWHQPCSIELMSKYQISLLNYAKIFFSALSAEVE